MQKFRKKVIEKIQDELEQVGFQKKRLGQSFCVLNQNTIGTVSLTAGKGLRTDELAIKPMIGVRNQTMGRLVSEITGEKFDRFYPPHACSNIGYLMPEKRWTTFIFCETCPSEYAIRGLVDAVKDYALPFMRRVSDLRELVHAMRYERISVPDTRIYHIPAGLFLLGEIEDAKSFLREKLVDFGEEENPASRGYKSFAIGLKKKIENS